MTNSNLPCRPWLLSLCCIASLVLSACDGGLFGTGDGGVVVDPDAAATSNPDHVDTGIDADTSQMPETMTGSFENLLIGSQTQSPLLNLINLTDRALSVTVDPGNQLLIDAQTSQQTSTAVALLANPDALTVFESQSSANKTGLSPLNLAAYSVTTLIARPRLTIDSAGSPDSTTGNEPGMENETTSWEIIPLPTLTIGNDSGVANVRIVQAIALDEHDTAATMTLRPFGDQPGGSEAVFSDVSATSAAISQYLSVAAGGYELVDSLNRFAAVELRIEAGQIYTLVITDTAEPVVLIQQDSLTTVVESPE